MSNSFRFSKKEIDAISVAGNAAPSGGNVQPWRVRFDEDKILILLDPVRSTSFLDAGHYASFLACGCLTENMCLEADTLGLRYSVKLFPFRTFDQPIVQINFLSRQYTKQFDSLAQYIPNRITNRQLSDGSILEPQIIIQLQKIALTEKNFQLSTVSDYPNKVKVADCLGKADGIRTINDNLFEQMMSEFRFSQDEALSSRDGLEMATLELPKHGAEMLELLRNFPKLRSNMPLKAFEDFARPLLLECSHFCCLSVRGRINTEIIIAAGRTLERIWLTATKLNVAFQPWSIVPFLAIRVSKFKGAGLLNSEKSEIKKVTRELQALFSLTPDHKLCFLFRLSRAKPPSAHSLRRSRHDYTVVTFDAMM